MTLMGWLGRKTSTQTNKTIILKDFADVLANGDRDGREMVIKGLKCLQQVGEGGKLAFHYIESIINHDLRMLVSWAAQ